MLVMFWFSRSVKLNPISHRLKADSYLKKVLLKSATVSNWLVSLRKINEAFKLSQELTFGKWNFGKAILKEVLSKIGPNKLCKENYWQLSHGNKLTEFELVDPAKLNLWISCIDSSTKYFSRLITPIIVNTIQTISAAALIRVKMPPIELDYVSFPLKYNLV